MTMDHPPEPLPPSPPPSGPVADEARLETLLRQTIAEQTADVAPSPDALPRLNARLDAAHAPKRWLAPFRLAGAVAVALILLALVTPVGRLAAANVTHGVQNTAQTVITTVKQIASGTSDSGTPPPQGTLPAPSATGAPASRTAPTNGAGSPVIGTAVNPSSVTRTGTPSGAGSAVAPVSPTPLIGTRAANTPASAAATASAPATVATPGTSPTATIATTTPSTVIEGKVTPVHETVSPAPIAHPTETVSPP